MSHTAITPELQQLHQLAYTPGTWMNDAWWTHLELTSWQASYHRFAACRPSINRLINQRRALRWSTLPASLTPQQQALLTLEPHFIRLITALGLVALNSPDHLLLKSYRQALMPRLDQHHCNQLLGLHQGWSNAQQPTPADALANAALQAGARWWQRDATPCPVTDMLNLHLPPTREVVVSQADNAVHWLIKIGRFL
ncbi:type III secretion system domain-containing protein [Pseudomonas sp. MDT1-17]